MAVTIVNDQIPRGPVTTTINYYSVPKDGSAPFNYVESPPAGQPERNYSDEAFSVTLQDARGREDEFNLDKDSFQLLSNVPRSKEKDFINDDSIRRNYYPEVEQLIFDNIPNCKKVFIFDHTIRSWNPNAARPPLTRCHLDQTPASAVARVRYHLPKEAEELLEGRFRIINIWMPVNGPVVEFPLGIVSASSAKEEEYVGIKHIYPDHDGETGGVKYSDEHQWYYWSGIDCNERIMLQCFDSDAFRPGSKVVGGRAPHSAFQDPRTPKNAAHRVSIEVRALVFC
ncbi:hypothetical protein NA57DRAFT_43828 [Rhizodiscina lignyota]|uniref:Methyltransferase n=1 Tax=Rhizodiscina lignyota TaxID=1504668 RepID=A0A9P4IA16_9PEZI|nr:hypothetical protein NA57DRAFT_43828 [Rhizodiscina lignyota]